LDKLPTNYKYLLYSLSKSLFNAKLSESDFIDVLPEALSQTVFPLVFSAVQNEPSTSAYLSQYYAVIANNVKVAEEHKALHKLLVANGIRYLFIKGCASARFYPDPLLRTMGDVDLLVQECDIPQTVDLLLQNGYLQDDAEDDGEGHISFHNQKNRVHIELHRQILGIPENSAGEKLKSLFADIFEKSVLENSEYYRPCDFHHGLILLLHTAQHLTREGVGLRHLCDWAVFVNSFSDNEFENLFKTDLTAVGLWQFANVLTAFAVEYLGCPPKKWCSKVDTAILEGLLYDVFSGGNFGKKDFSRYQHIKYISDRKDDDNTQKSPFKRLFNNIISKARSEIGFVKKMPWLLPIGVICVVFKYLWLIITGKRKMDSKSLISDALDRKQLYDSFKLFK
jgi:hypothetical protein